MSHDEHAAAPTPPAEAKKVLELAEELCSRKHDKPSNWQPCYFCVQEAAATQTVRAECTCNSKDLSFADAHATACPLYLALRSTLPEAEETPS